jgi:hypothetical protein
MNKELIELIINALTNEKMLHAQNIYQICEKAGYKRGTYTSYLSMMKKAGYVRRIKPQVYALGKMASTTTIDHNLRRLSLHNKQFTPTPEQKKAAKMVSETFESLKPASERMMDAIRVLKSFDLKVTIEF